MPGRKRKNPERIRILSDIIQTEVRRVFHCVAVTAVVQHFDIISAVPEGSALEIPQRSASRFRPDAL